jgi:hypothetical protein
MAAEQEHDMADHRCQRRTASICMVGQPRRPAGRRVDLPLPGLGWLPRGAWRGHGL